MEIGDTTVNDLMEYFYCVYPPNRPMQFKRMGSILLLADRYQNSVLLKTCKEFLSSVKTPDEKLQVLVWAHDYRMEDLFAHTLRRMKAPELKSFNSQHVFQFRPEYTEMLVKRLTTLL